jgi:MarR family transcriptional regulator, organic hydroperoxide resistance regulator
MNRKKTVCYNIKACWHTIARMYNSYGLDHEVSISMGYVLLNLSIDKGVPSTQIAPLLGMEPRSLTRLIKSMEEQGLIKKVTDKVDKRQVNIFLTDLGQKKRTMAAKIVKDFNDILRSKIEESELLIFNKVLGQISNITEQNFK